MMLSLLLAKHNFCLYQLQCAAHLSMFDKMVLFIGKQFKFSLILDLFSISIAVFDNINLG